MNNTVNYPKAPEKIIVDNVIEATPDGINFMRKNDDGLYSYDRMISYSSAIKHLDDGFFDAPLSDGFNIIAEIETAHINGWFVPDVYQQIIIWKWVVAATFFVEQISNGHLIDVHNEDGSFITTPAYVSELGKIPVFLVTERMALSNNVEGTAFEHYSRDIAPGMALAIYKSMIVIDADRTGVKLSEFGRESLNTLHEEFLIFLTSGESEQRVIH
ncbi:hypothetical protein ABLV58_11985 [Klebsiella sp. JB_Kp046]|uniref:hypothetical protein n=1 Tax=Klebsiella sp. JB_Kp046 TaxID=3153398 RepID=UPI0032B628DF